MHFQVPIKLSCTWTCIEPINGLQRVGNSRIPRNIFLIWVHMVKSHWHGVTSVSREIFTKPFLSWVPHWRVLVFIVALSPTQEKKNHT